jgi:hypothetical protein
MCAKSTEENQKGMIQSDLYGQMIADIDRINQLSPLGRDILEKTFEICRNNNKDEKMLLKDFKKYAVTLEAAHNYVR